MRKKREKNRNQLDKTGKTGQGCTVGIELIDHMAGDLLCLPILLKVFMF
jgi:hypothetical protein